MRKDVSLRPALQIEFGAGRQEGETGLRDPGAAFALQEDIKLCLELVQIKDIGGRIGKLFLGQLCRSPVGGLLLLGHVHADQFPREIFQAMPVGVGPHQPGGDLGAVDRAGHHTERMAQDCHIEARIVKDLEHGWIGQNGAKSRRCGLALGDLHHICRAVAARELDHAEPVPVRIEAKGFGVDGQGRAGFISVGQIALMKCDGHGCRAQK